MGVCEETEDDSYDVSSDGERRKHFCKMHDIRGVEIENIQELIGNIPKILTWMNISRGAILGAAFIAALLLAIITSTRTEINSNIERHQAKVDAQTSTFKADLEEQSKSLAVWKRVVEDNQLSITADRREIRESIKELNGLVTDLRLANSRNTDNKPLLNGRR
jgi:hypothetical protein